MTMFPVHQFDMHPHQRNQMQSAGQRYPSFEAIPPQMRADPDRLYNQSWPCSSYYGYPAQFHGCCEHHHFPGYSGLRSPYAQSLPPYYHGCYPVPPGAYTFQYIPPHYTMELPRYEYDKEMPGCYHCCGCPNHPCNRRVGKNVKIEEEGPYSENKADESLVPFNFRNHPNPLVWHLPKNLNNKEYNRANEPQDEKQEDGSQGAKIHYPYPIFCFPPNHTLNKEDNTSSEPQYDKQENHSSSAKTNYPYPILWFPPTYMRNKEGGMSNEPQYGEQETSDGSKTREVSKPSERERKFMDGWFPFDTNDLRPSKSQSPRQQKQQQGDDEPCFPFPVLWMPYKADESESKDNKRTGVGQESLQSAPLQMEVSPVRAPGAEENNNREVNNDIVGYRAPNPNQKEKTNVQKTIPVKQAELDEEEKKKEKTKSSEMPLNSRGRGELSEDGGKRKSSSLPKLSKLPPVCLRVDPLPKKKNGNGSSRSPSPPGNKGKSNQVSRENAKPTISLDGKGVPQQEIPYAKTMPERGKDKEQHKSKIKTIRVSDGTGSQAANGDSLPDSANERVLASQTNHIPRVAIDDLRATDFKCKNAAGVSNEGEVEDKFVFSSDQIDQNEEKSEAEEKPGNEIEEPKRKILSEAEAACIIQSAYRGYEVRRWEPLKKLKQVMEINRKVAELKSSIRAFELSADIQDVDRWRTLTSETIMKLLLKLDTIQGMHPSIRDVRKSVARELVGLQEQVDLLAQKNAEALAQQASPVSVGENMDNRDGLCIKENQKEEKQDLENSQLEIDPVNRFNQEVACEGQRNPGLHAVTNSGNLDVPGVLQDEASNSRESIEEAIATETELPKGNHGIDAFTNSQDPDIPMLVTDEGENFWEQIKGASAETELQNDVVIPQVGHQETNPAVGGLERDTCMLDGPVHNEEGGDRVLNDTPEGVLGGVVLKDELPTGVLDENIDVQENSLVNNDAREDEVSAGSYLKSELEQLPQGYEDDDKKSDKHVDIEEEEDKCETGAVKGDVIAEVADGGVLNVNQGEPKQETTLNQAEQRQETTLKAPITSEVNEDFECAKDEINAQVEAAGVLNVNQPEPAGQETTHQVPVTSEINKNSGCAAGGDNNDELLKVVDVGLEDAVQALDGETGGGFEAVDELEVHGKEGIGSKAENFRCDKSEVSAYFAEENGTPSTEPKEVSEVCKEGLSEPSLTGSQSRCTSGEENRLADADNSSSRDTSQQGDSPLKLSKSCDVEHEEMQFNDDFELAASGGAAEVDGMFAQICNSIALEQKPSDQLETVLVEAKQTEGQELPPSSPSASQISQEGDALSEGDKNLIEENMRLREMMQRLIEAGQEQLTAISNLSTRVKDLEKRISKKRKLKLRRNGTSRSSSGSSCLKPMNDPLKEKAVALAM